MQTHNQPKAKYKLDMSERVPMPGLRIRTRLCAGTDILKCAQERNECYDPCVSMRATCPSMEENFQGWLNCVGAANACKGACENEYKRCMAT